MMKNDKIIITIGVVILIIAGIGIYTWVPDKTKTGIESLDELRDLSGVLGDLPDSLIVSTHSPYYPLIVTPLAVHYNKTGEQEVLPLYVKDFNDPSKAIIRAEEMIGINSNVVIGDSSKSVKEYSLEIAQRFWENSDSVLIIEEKQSGYNLGLAAVPIASYLSIPVIVTDEVDNEVCNVLEKLGVESSIVCGNISGYRQTLKFETVDDIVNASMHLIENKFGEVDYITLANPLDITEPKVLETKPYHFDGTLSSVSFTMGHLPGMALGGLRGAPVTTAHEFEVPKDYKYARITIDAKNLAPEDVEETGGQLIIQPYDPNDERIGFLFTIGGVPERASDGSITEDRIHWDTIVYDQPGTYTLVVSGRIITAKTGDYEIAVTVENLETPVIPSMKSLSSVAPYLTAYHKGILFAKPEFAFASSEEILDDPASGIVYPVSNPDLIEDVNDHVFDIHESINEILAEIRGINFDKNNEDNLEELKNSYEDDPVHIALVGDATMIPYYYYYDTEDAITLYYGWDVAGDFIYGNIDPVPRNDRITIYGMDKLSELPYQENIVGRITGWDVQDASALITRTFFYENILENMDDSEWKNTATVQTGSGTDFQRLPVIDILRQLMPSVHELPCKWPTGQAHFENMMISEQVSEGGFNVISTENLQSMKRGFTQETIRDISKIGLNRIFLPKILLNLLAGDNRIQGGDNQENSNFIYSFGHGQPMGYLHGDVQLEAMSFRPVILDQILSRWTTLPIMSGLGTIGGYNVRAVENMDLGPSVMMVESCYVGRIDGLYPECCISQAYLHSGVNTFIASSRGTPGPGYLDARRNDIGFGLIEYIKTRRNPDLQDPHFSSLHAMNIFEDLTENNLDVGTAFRNAKNKFLPTDYDSEFFWTPPLSLAITTQADLDLFNNNIKPTSDDDAKCLEKKYTCLYEYNLFGDPAFNPYEPANN